MIEGEAIELLHFEGGGSMLLQYAVNCLPIVKGATPRKT
jgi:hypothetical protein